MEAKVKSIEISTTSDGNEYRKVHTEDGKTYSCFDQAEWEKLKISGVYNLQIEESVSKKDGRTYRNITKVTPIEKASQQIPTTANETPMTMLAMTPEDRRSSCLYYAIEFAKFLPLSQDWKTQSVLETAEAFYEWVTTGKRAKPKTAQEWWHDLQERMEQVGYPKPAIYDEMEKRFNTKKPSEITEAQWLILFAIVEAHRKPEKEATDEPR